MSAVCLIIAATSENFFINTSMGNSHWPRCFHYVVKLILFISYGIVFFSFYFIFLILCLEGKPFFFE